MIEATTPTIKLKLPEDIDLTPASDIYATFRQHSIVITKTLGNGVELLEPNIIAVTLTQEETLRFVAEFLVDIQVNWIDNGARYATKKKHVNVEENLIPEVISS